ncbi:MAG TPA: SRPBCC family protein [Candidatus Dormibacteraeota bacterium]|nr:SRPBCC family protein [Candidatus Dormibacteraeota bacterium]
MSKSSQTERRPSVSTRQAQPDAAEDASTSVRFSIIVHAPIEHAFRVFTDRFDTWWPREHHIGSVPMAVAMIEPRAGGRWFELGVDGSQCDWGVVLAWEPPAHVALSWHLDGDFRFDASAARASRVDIRFRALDTGTTEVVLEHSGLDRHGETWRRLKDGISRGWPLDLRLFAEAAQAAPDVGTSDTA